MGKRLAWILAHSGCCAVWTSHCWHALDDGDSSKTHLNMRGASYNWHAMGQWRASGDSDSESPTRQLHCQWHWQQRSLALAPNSESQQCQKRAR